MSRENNVTFYHGTNTVFIEYIKKHGLGGYDIVKESRGIELLSKLNEIAENVDGEKYMDVGLLRLSVTGILLQTPGDTMNWQHGSVYITPSINRALKYACLNELGSELFTYIYHVYNFLSEQGVKEVLEIMNNYPLVKEIIFKKGDPIVIEFQNLKEEDLLSEGGENPMSRLKDLDVVINSNDNKDDLDDFGFRLKKTIPFDQLVIRPIKKS
jgi:hypothetical protein